MTDGTPRFQRVNAGRSFELVIRQLRRAIAAGHLKPGEKLPAEPRLASELGVSRSVVREALKVLELSGDVEVRRGYGGGTFIAVREAEEFTIVRAPAVPRFTSVSPRQLYDVRIAIEPHAARLATAASVNELAALNEPLLHMRTFGDRPAHVLAAAVDFHVAVAQAAGNPVFVAVMQALRPVIYRAMNPFVRDPAWPEVCRREHERIIKEIESGDPDRAEEAMQTHLTRKEADDA